MQPLLVIFAGVPGTLNYERYLMQMGIEMEIDRVEGEDPRFERLVRRIEASPELDVLVIFQAPEKGVIERAPFCLSHLRGTFRRRSVHFVLVQTGAEVETGCEGFLGMVEEFGGVVLPPHSYAGAFRMAVAQALEGDAS